MIRARHHLLAKAIFYSYIHMILRKDYSRFWLSGRLPDFPGDRAVLAVPNHIGWWDGFFIHGLNRLVWKRPFYIMMLERQLRRYWYFRFVGAYSVRPGSPRSVRESMEYTAGLLSHPKNLVVMYPEGELRSQFLPPGELMRGIEWLARNDASPPFTLLPVTFLVQPWDLRKPEIVVRCAGPVPSERVASEPGLLRKTLEENRNGAIGAMRTRDFTGELFGREGEGRRCPQHE